MLARLPSSLQPVLPDKYDQNDRANEEKDVPRSQVNVVSAENVKSSDEHYQEQVHRDEYPDRRVFFKEIRARHFAGFGATFQAASLATEENQNAYKVNGQLDEEHPD